jgi:hypothetical protein
MSVWIAIHPNATETRVLATTKGTRPLLKARLATRPKHPRALPTLLEAIALWQGEKAHAVLLADDRASTCGTNLFTDCFAVVEPTPLFQLGIVGGINRPGPRDTLCGLGPFADLQRLLLEEASR